MNWHDYVILLEIVDLLMKLPKNSVSNLKDFKIQGYKIQGYKIQQVNLIGKSTFTLIEDPGLEDPGFWAFWQKPLELLSRLLLYYNYIYLHANITFIYNNYTLHDYISLKKCMIIVQYSNQNQNIHTYDCFIC